MDVQSAKADAEAAAFESIAKTTESTGKQINAIVWWQTIWMSIHQLKDDR